MAVLAVRTGTACNFLERTLRLYSLGDVPGDGQIVKSCTMCGATAVRFLPFLIRIASGLRTPVADDEPTLCGA